MSQDTPNKENALKAPKQAILLAGGTSVCKLIENGLWDKIKDRFIIGINFTHKVFIPSMPIEPTLLTFRDTGCFYLRYLEKLKSIPLIVGKYHQELKEIKLPNTILLKDINGGLAGIWALNLAIRLMEQDSEIFILGMDCGGIPTVENLNYKMNGIPLELQDITNWKISKHCKGQFIKIDNKKYIIKSHWYQEEFTHKGISRLGFYYAKDRVEKYFGKFRNQSKVKIYNVSPYSRISSGIFPKIDYSTFFSKLNNNTYDQNLLREQIKMKLK